DQTHGGVLHRALAQASAFQFVLVNPFFGLSTDPNLQVNRLPEKARADVSKKLTAVAHLLGEHIVIAERDGQRSVAEFQALSVFERGMNQSTVHFLYLI